MNSSSSNVNNSLTAPGRMDVVEQIVKSDRVLSGLARESGRRTITNRRGVPKSYSKLTVDLVHQLASAGLDAVTMQRQDIISEAFRFCTPKSELEELVA